MGNPLPGGCPFFMEKMMVQLKRLLAYQHLNLVLKVLLLLLLSGLLYFELTVRDDLPKIWLVFYRQLQGANIIWLLLTLVLMPLNWLAETQKWRPFVNRFEPLSQWKALRAVLAGVAVSLFTPNRVGEYGGRILYIRPENRWKAVIVNLVGNFAQFIVLLSAGTAGAIWMMSLYGHLELLYVQAFAFVASIGLVMVFLIYFNIKYVIPIARKIPLLHRIKPFVKNLRVLEHFKRRELLFILKWATVRYSIFASQYLLLLKFFDIKTSIISGYAGISAIFLIQTSLPLPPVTGLIARGNLAVQVWGQVGANEVSSLAATFVLWIINLILPALVGTFSLLYVNIAKMFVHENDSF